MPNNYLRVKLNFVVDIMDVFFFQSWNFFAPPPDYDLRLYYVFTDELNKKYVFEAIKPILNEKKRKAPFNSGEEYLDYVISGSATSIIDVKSNYFDYFKFTFKDSTDKYCSDTAVKTININYKTLPGYLTLINYSSLVRKKNLNSIKIKNCKFILTGLMIPKFSERFSNKRAENKYFESIIFKP